MQTWRKYAFFVFLPQKFAKYRVIIHAHVGFERGYKHTTRKGLSDGRGVFD